MLWIEQLPLEKSIAKKKEDNFSVGHLRARDQCDDSAFARSFIDDSSMFALISQENLTYYFENILQDSTETAQKRGYSGASISNLKLSCRFIDA